MVSIRRQLDTSANCGKVDGYVKVGSHFIECIYFSFSVFFDRDDIESTYFDAFDSIFG